MRDKTLTVKFLTREYSIPESLISYIKLQENAENLEHQLMQTFIYLVSRSEIGLVETKDMQGSIEHVAEYFVSLLCEREIYDRTIQDYLRDNTGYIEFNKVNADALEMKKRFLSEDIDRFVQDMDRAYDSAASKITGTGVRVFSSSFLTLAASSAYEYSVIKKQCKQADEQYQKELSSALSTSRSRQSARDAKYLKETYIPRVENAFTLLVCEILDRYLKDCIANGIYQDDFLNWVNLERSNQLLNNVKLTNNKAEVLRTAFQCCPYNVQVYLQANELGLLDTESEHTMSILRQRGLYTQVIEARLEEKRREEERLRNLELEKKRKIEEENRRKAAELERRKREQERKEEQEKQRLEQEKRLKAFARKWFWVPIIAVILVIAVISYTTYINPKIIVPKKQFTQACSLLNEGKWDEAKKIFAELGDYNNAASMCNECDYQKALSLIDNGKFKDAERLLKQLGDYSEAEDALSRAVYGQAQDEENEGDYQKAEELYSKIGEYMDASEKKEEMHSIIVKLEEEAAEAERLRQEEAAAKELERKEAIYATAIGYLEDGQNISALNTFKDILDFKDSQTLYSELQIQVADRHSIAASGYGSFAIKKNGTVVMVGNGIEDMSSVSEWSDIVDIAAGDHHVVGLCKDGTVKVAGSNRQKQDKTGDWKNIISVAAGVAHTVGLVSDGTVVATGYNEKGQCNVDSWTDIVMIAAGSNCTLGLKSNGDVLIAGGYSGMDTSGWKNIVYISANFQQIAGVDASGRVYHSTSVSADIDTSNWNDVVRVIAGDHYLVGITSAGTAYASGKDYHGETAGTNNMTNVEDIVIFTSSSDTCEIVLKKNGTVLFLGNGTEGQADISGITDVRLE